MRKTTDASNSPEKQFEFDEAFEHFRALVDPQEIYALQSDGPGTVYTSQVTVWMLVYQRLHANATLTDAVTDFIESNPAEVSSNRRVLEERLSANTGAYSRARKRLKPEVTDWVANYIYTTLTDAFPPFLDGRRAFILDGTTIKLAPTKALRAAFPPASNQHGAGVWPIAHLLVAHELESGCAILPEIGAMYGADAISEVALTKRIMSRLPAHSILLADRNFGVFAVAYTAVEAGHDVLLRLTRQRFEALVRKAQLLPQSKPGQRCWKHSWTPSAKERKSHPELPANAAFVVTLHEIKISKTLTLLLVTTLDHPPAILAALYGRRQDVETDIRDVKVTLKLEEVRAHSVEMLKKEIATSMVAYNLVIQVRRLAAKLAGVKPRRLSFSGVWSAVRIILMSPHHWTSEQWRAKFRRALKIAGQRKLPNRPGRSYERKALPRRNKSTSGSRKTAGP